ncbi:MAG TPA: hypothetical protein DEP66_01995 [Acidimicrobiaceae bacterium]|nr:hypothetical protein [Acidimicrobiaceae bacterium]
MPLNRSGRRLITIHLPALDSAVTIDSRDAARRLVPTVDAPDAALVAVLAGADRELRAFASGGCDLVVAMIENGYPFVCLVDLLEIRWVWVFAPAHAVDLVRASLRKASPESESDFGVDVSSLRGRCAGEPAVAA